MKTTFKTLLIISTLALTGASAHASEFNRGFFSSGNSGELKGGLAPAPAPDYRAAEREAAEERQAEMQRQHESALQDQQRQIEQLQRNNRYQ